MKNKKITIAIVIIVIFVIFILIFQKNFNTTNNAQNNPYDAFAQCITDSGAKLYCADWAPQCINQKKIFGENAKFLTYIECSKPDSRDRNMQCKEDGIEQYPTWEFGDGTRIEDFLSFEKLEKKTNCKAPATNKQ